MPLVTNVTDGDLDVNLIGRHFPAGVPVEISDAEAELLAGSAQYTVDTAAPPAEPTPPQPAPAAEPEPEPGPAAPVEKSEE